MRLPQAFRSLARPSSALEPSHPPASTVANGIECRWNQSRLGRRDRLLGAYRDDRLCVCRSDRRVSAVRSGQYTGTVICDVHEPFYANGFSGRLDCARTHGRHCTSGGGRSVRRTLPIRAFTGWCISSLGSHPRAVSHLRDVFRDDERPSMDPLGFEPRASSLQRRCSTAELRALLALVVLRCLSGRSGTRSTR